MVLSRSLFVVSIALTFAFGLLMVFNTSSADILDRSLAVSTHQYVVRHIVFALLGVLLATIPALIGLDTLIHLARPLLLGTAFLLLLCFVPGIGVKLNGARRWIGVAGYTLQPSELLKLTLPLYLIALLQNYSGRSLIAGLGLALLPIALVVLQPDNGTGVILLMSVGMVLFISGVPWRYWLLPLAVLSSLAVVVAFQSSYVIRRLEVYLHPELDLLGKGHQPYQAKIAAGSGGFFGVGLGQSMQKLSYLPEAQNDYIAAIFAEEMGFVGIFALILLYAVMTLSAFCLVMRAADRPTFYLGTTLVFLIALHAFFNLGVVSGLVPSTGLNLPFFSQGGTSLLANLAIAGMILAIPTRESVRWKTELS